MRSTLLSNKLTVLISLLMLTIPSVCLTSSDDKESDIPSFFDDPINYYFFFGGIGMIFLSTIIAVIVCRIGQKRKRAGEGLLEKSDDEDD
jgi:hypothetical protein